MLITQTAMLRILKAQHNTDAEKKMLLKGTILSIAGKPDFQKTDGYIQFLKLCIKQIPKACGRQDFVWQEQLDRLCMMADRLQNASVQFQGSTQEEFQAYCKRLSSVFKDTNPFPLPALELESATSDENLTPILEDLHARKAIACFYFNKTENMEKQLLYDLAKRLDGMRFKKTGHTASKFVYLTKNKYHEHVHDALNILLRAGSYAMSCSSTRTCRMYAADVIDMRNRMDYAKAVMEQTENVM